MLIPFLEAEIQYCILMFFLRPVSANTGQNIHIVYKFNIITIRGPFAMFYPSLLL